MNPHDEQPEPLATTTTTIELTGVAPPGRWQRRGATSVAVAALLAAGTTGVVVLNQRGDDAGDRLQAAPREAAPHDAAAAGNAPDVAGLQWTAAAEPGRGLGWSTDIAIGDDENVYSLSTAPGVHDPNQEWTPEPQILYRSPDGSEWTVVGVPGDLWASSLDAADGRLYAIGTGPAAAAEGEPYGLQVGASSDGGATWSHTSLPLDLAGLKDAYGDNVSAGAAQLAVSSDGAVLAAMTLQAWADPYELLPADVDQRWGVTQTADGFDVNGPPADLTAAGADGCPADWVLQEDALAGAQMGFDKAAAADGGLRPMPAAGAVSAESAPDDLWCVAPDGAEAQPVWAGEVAGPVARSFTWEELGVDAGLQSLLAGEPHVFLAADGMTFEEVAVELPADGRVAQLTPVATPDGFMLLASVEPLAFDASKEAYVDPSIAVLSSADGRTWVPHPAGDLSGWVRNAGVVGDTVAVVFDAASGEASTFMSITQVATSTAGSAWTVTSPSDLVEPGSGGVFVGDVAVGPVGLVALVGAQGDPIVDRGGADIAGYAAGAAGYTLRMTNQSGAAQLLDASGAVVAETASIHDDRADDAFGWDTTYTTLTITDLVSGATLATFSSESIDGAMYPANDEWQSPTWSVVHSVDGVTWAAQPLADLIGENPLYASVVVTASAAVVSGYFPTPEVASPDRQVVAVGTPG